jgi:type I restriction enzyme R subunit
MACTLADTLAGNCAAVDKLAESIKRKATLDWTQRDTVRADMRRTVRRLLAKYGYPPDAQESATQLIIRQAELMASNQVS